MERMGDTVREQLTVYTFPSSREATSLPPPPLETFPDISPRGLENRDQALLISTISLFLPLFSDTVETYRGIKPGICLKIYHPTLRVAFHGGVPLLLDFGSATAIASNFAVGKENESTPSFRGGLCKRRRRRRNDESVVFFDGRDWKGERERERIIFSPRRTLAREYLWRLVVVVEGNVTEEFSGIRVFLFFSWITDLESIYIYMCIFFL